VSVECHGAEQRPGGHAEREAEEGEPRGAGGEGVGGVQDGREGRGEEVDVAAEQAAGESEDEEDGDAKYLNGANERLAQNRGGGKGMVVPRAQPCIPALRAQPRRFPPQDSSIVRLAVDPNESDAEQRQHEERNPERPPPPLGLRDPPANHRPQRGPQQRHQRQQRLRAAALLDDEQVSHDAGVQRRGGDGDAVETAQRHHHADGPALRLGRQECQTE